MKLAIRATKVIQRLKVGSSLSLIYFLVRNGIVFKKCKLHCWTFRGADRGGNVMDNIHMCMYLALVRFIAAEKKPSLLYFYVIQ